jgi:hypothetical protein
MITIDLKGKYVTCISQCIVCSMFRYVWLNHEWMMCSDGDDDDVDDGDGDDGDDDDV